MIEARHPYLDEDYTAEGPIELEDDLHKTAKIKNFFIEMLDGIAEQKNIGKEFRVESDSDITGVFWSKRGVLIDAEVGKVGSGYRMPQQRRETFEVRDISASIKVVGEGVVDINVAGKAGRQKDLEISFAFPLDGSVDFMIMDAQERNLTIALNTYGNVPTYKIY